MLVVLRVYVEKSLLWPFPAMLTVVTDTFLGYLLNCVLSIIVLLFFLSLNGQSLWFSSMADLVLMSFSAELWLSGGRD